MKPFDETLLFKSKFSWQDLLLVLPFIPLFTFLAQKLIWIFRHNCTIAEYIQIASLTCLFFPFVAIPIFFWINIRCLNIHDSKVVLYYRFKGNTVTIPKDRILGYSISEIWYTYRFPTYHRIVFDTPDGVIFSSLTFLDSEEKDAVELIMDKWDIPVCADLSDKRKAHLFDYACQSKREKHFAIALNLLISFLLVSSVATIIFEVFSIYIVGKNY